MTEKQKKLQELLEDVLTERLFSGVEVDELLDMRDAMPFDQQWVDARQELTKTRLMNSLSEQEKGWIEQIRERAYFLTYEKSGDGELAGYVSDDFEMIAEAVCTKQKQPWIYALLDQYISGKIPHGDLQGIDKSWDECLGHV